MKRVLNILVLSGVVLAAFAGGVGCKMGGSEVNRERPTDPAGESPPAESEAPIAQLLNLRIVPAGEDPELPDPALDLGSERRTDAAVFQGNEVQFTDNIWLADPQNPTEFAKALFFVWGKELANVPIVSAAVDHRLVDQRNQQVGEVTRLPAWVDPVSQRWYVPLKTLLADSLADCDPAYQHLVHLDLVLSSGDRLVVSVRFRTLGPLSGPAFMERRLPRRADAVELRTGWVLRAEKVRNPLSRPIRLWFRASAVSDLVARLMLTKSAYRHEPDPVFGLYLGPPTGPHERAEWLDTPLSLSSVRIRQGREHLDLRLPESGEWVSAVLPARADWEFEWMAKALDSASAARVPEPFSRELRWNVPVDPNGGSLTIPERSGIFVDTWRAEEIRNLGKWKGEIAVSFPWGQARAVVRSFEERGSRI